MRSMKYLIKKNIILFIDRPVVAIIELFFPVIILLLTIFFRSPYLDKNYVKNLNYTGITYEINNNNSIFETNLIRKNFINRSLGIIFGNNFSEYNPTNRSQDFNLTAITLDYLTNKNSICSADLECQIINFDNETEYIKKGALHKQDGSALKELIRIFTSNQSPYSINYTLYSRNFPVYSKDNEISELYNIPTMFSHEEAYVDTFQVYFYKFLKGVLSDTASNTSVNISIIPMKTHEWVRMTDNHTEIKEYPVSVIRNTSISFMLISLSFVSIVILFGNKIVYEKQLKIKDLLKYQGVSLLEYYLSWFISFNIVLFIPMFIFYFLLIFIWLKFQISTMFFTIIALFLQNSNILSYIFISSIFVTNRKTSKWIIYFAYFLTIFTFMLFNYFYQYSKIFRAPLYCIPNINFAMSLELLFLGTNYENGMGLEVSTKYHKDITFLGLIGLGVFVFISNTLIYVGYEFLKHRTLFHEKEKKPEENTRKRSGSHQVIGRFVKHFEEVSEQSLVNQRYRNEALIVSDLGKRYNESVALKNINCTFYKGKVFVLLGHNGSGKSTLLGLISGRIVCDNGDIRLENHSLLTDKTFLYQNLGLCLQENIYFPEMKVLQQIKLISEIKTGSANIEEVDNLIDKLGLKPFVDIKASSLPPEILRKLCIAFALVGNSKLLILDEPTSGMDNKTKKEFWEFLQTIKNNKIVIITTHSIEEAEFLGDFIGILSEGELVCKGSPTYLKKMYPCGYNINFIFEKNSLTFKEKAEFIYDVKKIEPKVLVKILSKDLIKLNFPESSLRDKKVQKIFQMIEKNRAEYKLKEYTVSTTSLEDVFFKVNDNEFTEMFFDKELRKVFEEIEKERDNEKTDEENLEDFNSLGGGILDLKEKGIPYEINQAEGLETQENQQNLLSEENLGIQAPNNDTNTVRTSSTETSEFSFLINNKAFPEIKPIQPKIVLHHLKRLIQEQKRKTLSTLYEIFWSGFSLVFLVTLRDTDFSNSCFYFINLYKYFPNKLQVFYQVVGDDSEHIFDKYLEKPNYDNVIVDMTSVNYLKNITNETTIEELKEMNEKNSSLFGDKKNFLIIQKVNETTINYINFFSASSPDITHTIVNNILRKHLSFSNIPSEMMWGYSLNPNYYANGNIEKFKYNYIIFTSLIICHIVLVDFLMLTPIRDEKSEVKRLVMLSFGQIQKYWIALFVFQYIKYLIISLLIHLVTSFVLRDIWYNFPLSVIFGISMLLLSYAITIFSSNGKKAFIAFFVINLVCLLITFFKKEFSYPRLELEPEINLWYLFMPSSSYAFIGYAIREFQMTTKLNYTFFDIHNISILFKGFLASAIQSVFWIAFIIAKETNLKNKLIYLFSKEKSFESHSHTLSLNLFRPLDESYTGDISDINLAIDREESLLNDSLNPEEGKTIEKKKSTLIFFIENLVVRYKSLFKKTVTAVDRLSLGLERDEKFALIGPNGVGKTSIIKSIIGAVKCESGNIEFLGNNVLKNFSEIRDRIGYCPQENSLFENLTVQETFFFFDRQIIDPEDIGISKKINEYQEEKIYKIMKQFDLFKHKDVLTKNLSEGNKRKLLFGIALMNNPYLCLLDEPSTGVDPESRRIMWKNIAAIHRAKKSMGESFNLILATQSIEEAEIVCDSIGLMKEGKFTYVGNLEKLKLKLSKGYYIKLRVRKPNSSDLTENLMLSNNNLQHLSQDVKNGDLLKKYGLPLDTNNVEGIFYLNTIEEFCDLLIENDTKVEFLSRMENEFTFILEVSKNKKGTLFCDLLNIKNLMQNITDVSIGIEPFNQQTFN